jgi:hypothetical protein
MQMKNSPANEKYFIAMYIENSRRPVIDACAYDLPRGTKSAADPIGVAV